MNNWLCSVSIRHHQSVALSVDIQLRIIQISGERHVRIELQSNESETDRNADTTMCTAQVIHDTLALCDI